MDASGCVSMTGALLGVVLLSMNDSAMHGIGGSARPMRGESPVRMISEDVRISIPEMKVETVFVFENQGPARMVRMGFPEEGWNATPTPKRPTFFLSFRSWVDGREVKATVQPGPPDDLGEQYAQWWVKDVRFGRNQRRTVRNLYRSEAGMTASSVSLARYILTTGANWRGTIGKARIVADLTALPRGTRFSAHPTGFQREGAKLIWEYRDFNPTKHHDIGIAWEGEELYWTTDLDPSDLHKLNESFLWRPIYTR